MYRVIWVDDFVGENYEVQFKTKEEAKHYIKKEVIQDPDFFHEIEESDTVEFGMQEYIEIVEKF